MCDDGRGPDRSPLRPLERAAFLFLAVVAAAAFFVRPDGGGGSRDPVDDVWAKRRTDEG